jgi:trans-aconitate methyltransferase
VESAFGVHLILIRERIPGRAPVLEAIRGTVVRRWKSARREEVSEAFYQSLRQRYSIIVEEVPETDDGEVAMAAEIRR